MRILATITMIGGLTAPEHHREISQVCQIEHYRELHQNPYNMSESRVQIECKDSVT